MENEEVIDQQPEESENEENVLRKVEVKLSAKYDVPLCYVEFFKPKPKEPKEPKEGKEGDENKKGDEEESDSDDEIISGKKVKFSNDGEKPNVIVMVKQRSKRKNTTTIANLEPWGVDIKELTKHIKKSMAIGCSTTKTATGQQIVIQGDAGEPVINLLRSEFHIPMKSITPIKKVKKAPEPKQPAAQPVYDLGPSSDDDDNDNDDYKHEQKPDEDHDEEEEFENPNRPNKKNKQRQQQQQQHQEQQHDNKEENQNNQHHENQHNQHHENRGRGGNNNRGGRGGRGGNNNNRGGRGGRGGNNNRGGRGRGRH